MIKNSTRQILMRQPDNLLKNSEALNAWSSVLGTTVSQNTILSPYNTLTADRINFTTSTGNRLQNSTETLAIPGNIYTGSCWLKGSGTMRLITDIPGHTFRQILPSPGETIINLTSEWVRYSTTTLFESNTLASSPIIRLLIIWRTGDTATTVDAWGGQINSGFLAPYKST